MTAIQLVQALTSIHQSQHQAPVSLHVDQAEQEDRQVFWALLEALGTPAAAPVVAGSFPDVTITNMEPQDDSESFVGLFEHSGMGMARRSIGDGAAMAHVGGSPTVSPAAVYPQPAGEPRSEMGRSAVGWPHAKQHWSWF